MADLLRFLEAGWDAQVNAAFAEIEREATAIARGVTVETFKLLLQNTPQFYGRMVESWTYNINSPREYAAVFAAPDRNEAGHRAVAAFIMGDAPAIRQAISHNSGFDAGFKLGDTVFMTNAIDWADKIENSKEYAPRPGNLGAPVHRTMAIVEDAYKQIESSTMMESLMKARIA